MLSAEIVVIATGTVQDAAFATQVAVIASIAVLMTVGVYGLVAGIVKLDDAGFHLVKDDATHAWAGFKRILGQGLLRVAPYLMKTLSIVGTAAMFLVGGGILLHGLPYSHEVLHHAEAAVHALPCIGEVLAPLTPTLLNLLVGVGAGGLALAGVNRTKALLDQRDQRPDST